MHDIARLTMVFSQNTRSRHQFVNPFRSISFIISNAGDESRCEGVTSRNQCLTAPHISHGGPCANQKHRLPPGRQLRMPLLPVSKGTAAACVQEVIRRKIQLQGRIGAQLLRRTGMGTHHTASNAKHFDEVEIHQKNTHASIGDKPFFDNMVLT